MAENKLFAHCNHYHLPRRVDLKGDPWLVEPTHPTWVPYPQAQLPCKLQVLRTTMSQGGKFPSSDNSMAMALTPMSTLWPRAHQPQVQAHTLRKWWDVISTLRPYPQRTRLIYTKAAFLSLADGRVAARAHVAREKTLGSGPETLWTAVICLENISPQSDVFRTWAQDTLSLSVTKINSFQYSSKYLGFSLVMAAAILAYWIFYVLKPASFWKRNLMEVSWRTKTYKNAKLGSFFSIGSFLEISFFQQQLKKNLGLVSHPSKRNEEGEFHRWKEAASFPYMPHPPHTWWFRTISAQSI